MQINKLINDYKYMGKPAKATLWYTLCNILQKGISLLVIPIYVRMLTTTEYGGYTVFQSWREILMIFATLNLYCGVFTKAMVNYENDRDRYSSSMQGLGSVCTTLFLIVYSLNIKFWNRVFDIDTISMILLVAYFYVFPSVQYWSVRQRVEYKYKRMVAVTIGLSLAAPLLSIVLLKYTQLRTHAVIWGYLISQICFGLFFYIKIFCEGKCFYDKDYWRNSLKFNIPLIPHYLSLIVLAQSDRIMIKEFCGEDKSAIYSLAYQISVAMTVFVAAINSSLVPWTYSKLKDKSYNEIRKSSNYLCCVIALMSIFAMLVAPEIISLIGTKEYYSAIWIVPAVTGSTYFAFCYELFSTIEFYNGSTHYVMIASIVGSILNVILNAIFIPIFGFVAAGYTTFFCYFVFMIMHYFFMKKSCLTNNIEEKIYDIPFMSASVVIVVIAAVLCLLVYEKLILRYSLILLLIIAMIASRKRIENIIRRIMVKQDA